MEESKLQREDHDTLIRLETKVDQIVQNVVELRDGTALKIADLDLRLKSVERVHDQINPLATAGLVKKHELFITDYQATHKERKAVVGYWLAILSLGVSAIAAISNYTKYFFK